MGIVVCVWCYVAAGPARVPTLTHVHTAKSVHTYASELDQGATGESGLIELHYLFFIMCISLNAKFQ